VNDDLQAVLRFLMGEAPLEGVNFGEKHPTKAGAYWWRLNLRAGMHAETQVQAADESRG
jgi:hypothetical protein